MESVLFIYVVLFGVLGALLGSLANVLIYRLPAGEDVVFKRSHCRECKKTIPWYFNVPVLSWFLLGGRCGFCKKFFSFRYVLVECLGAGLFMALFYKTHSMGWVFVLEYCLLAWALLVCSFIDLDHMVLPDIFTVGGVFVYLGLAFLNPGREFLPAFYCAIVGGGGVLFVAYAYKLLAGQDGIGGGDIKLMAWLGAAFGEYEALLFIMFVGCLAGAAVGGVVAFRSAKGLQAAIPFGPFLAAAAILYIFCGSALINWYWIN